jgi:hypothetical protein
MINLVGDVANIYEMWNLAPDVGFYDWLVVEDCHYGSQLDWVTISCKP